MNQPRRCQSRITLPPHLHEFIFSCSVLEMLVVLPVFRNSREGHWSFSAFWWVVVAYPNLGVFGKRQQLAT
jgi:hypothetical protein